MADKSKKPAIRFAGFTDAWEQRKLGELAEFSKGQGYTKSDLRESGIPIILYGRLYTKYQPIIREVDTFADATPQAVFSKGGEVILPSSGETAEDIAIAASVDKSGFLLGGGLNIVLPHKEIDSAFLAIEISFGTPHTELAKRAQGKSVVHLYNEDLKAVEISYPTIAEQKQISTLFDSFDNLITLHQRKYDKLQNVKKSMLEKMFPKNGSDVPEIRFAGFTDAWEQRKVREVADRYDNLRIPVAANLRIPGSTPYYGANGIQDYVDGFTHDGEFVLVAEDGANDLKNYPVKCVKGRIWVNNHAHVLQGKQESTDNCFLAYAISQADIESILVGGSRAKLNAETLMEVLLLLPSKAEQSQIGEYFERLDHLITLHQRELEKLKNLKKACLEKMFV